MVSKSILVLEDEVELQEPLTRAITKIVPSAAVTFSHTVEHAISELERKEKFELILSDIILPGDITGIDFWQKCQERIPGTPFYFMSGLPRDFYLGMLPEDKTGQLPGFIAKPFTTKELRQLLSDLFRDAA